MSGTATKQSTNLAGSKRRSLSGQGGLLNRMFGGSNNGSKEAIDASTGGESSPTESPQNPNPSNNIASIPESNDESKDQVSHDMRSPTRKSVDETGGEKKRRSSKDFSLHC